MQKAISLARKIIILILIILLIMIINKIGKKLFLLKKKRLENERNFVKKLFT